MLSLDRTSEEYIDFGDMVAGCLGNPGLCTSGFTVEFWIKMQLGYNLVGELPILQTVADSGTVDPVGWEIGWFGMFF